ncbi:MAG: hypothetical protein ABIS23_06930 [Sphingomicrobium sp.]
MKALAWVVLAVAGAGLAAESGLAQSSGSAVIYGNGNFKGRSLTLTGPLQGLEVAFTAKSIRIGEGGSWEFCSGKTFSGCKRLDKSVKAGVFTVRSARPIAPVVRSAVEAPNQSLRGMTSEYFVSPRQGNDRLSIGANSPEEMRTKANAFCRAAGWRQAIHAQLQAGNGVYYVIDVLCGNYGS